MGNSLFLLYSLYAGMNTQVLTRDSLPWRSALHPYTAWVGFIGSTTITLITGFHVSLKEIGLVRILSLRTSEFRFLFRAHYWVEALASHESSLHILCFILSSN